MLQVLPANWQFSSRLLLLHVLVGNSLDFWSSPRKKYRNNRIIVSVCIWHCHVLGKNILHSWISRCDSVTVPWVKTFYMRNLICPIPMDTYVSYRVDILFKASTCTLMYNRQSPSFILWWSKLELPICPPPLQLLLHRRAALSTISKGTQFL
jgi:hypothetical protein